MDLSRRLALVAYTELASVVATRVVLHHYAWSSVEAELIRTALRIATAFIYWQLLKSVILSRTPHFRSFKDHSVVVGVVVFLSIPVLVGKYHLTSQIAVLFALASVPVAIKEEILFRGIVQNLLAERYGALKAVLLASTGFTIWHVGVWEPRIWTFAEVFFASVLLGLLYVRSGSMLAVIALHAVYDGLYSFTPLVPRPLPEVLGIVPLLCAVALVYAWASDGKGLAQAAKGRPGSGAS